MNRLLPLFLAAATLVGCATAPQKPNSPTTGSTAPTPQSAASAPPKTAGQIVCETTDPAVQAARKVPKDLKPLADGAIAVASGIPGLGPLLQGAIGLRAKNGCLAHTK